jgi:hypothetical protein
MIPTNVRNAPTMAAILLLVALCAGLGAAPAVAQETVRVSTAEELVRALGPGRTILLEPGSYDLATAYRVQTRHASWEEVFDGQQLVIHELSGLTVRAEMGATIVAQPRYSYTLSFVDCREILLDGLTLGHTEAGYCIGGVVRLERSEQVYLEGCALYGSGTVGLDITDCRDVTVRGSAISQCTAGGVWARGSAHLSFVDVELLENDCWPLIDLAACLDVSFQNCRIAENFGGSLLAVDADSRYISVSGALIERNGTEGLLSEWSEPVDLTSALIRDNGFPDDEGAYYGEGEYSGEEYADDEYDDYDE